MKRLLFSLLIILTATSFSFGQKAQLILTNKDYGSFDAAKSHAISKVTDGDELWLFAKFDKPVHQLIEATDAYGKKAYYLTVSIGANGETKDFNSDDLAYQKDEVNGNELKINLAPGVPGVNSSSSVMLSTVSRGSPGVWNNSIRLSKGSEGMGNKIVFGTVPITIDVSNGMGLYKNQNAKFNYVIRGAQAAKLSAPKREKLAGEEQLIPLIEKAAKNAGMNFKKAYMTSNAYGDERKPDGTIVRFAKGVVLYQKDGKCFYALARLEAAKDEKTKKTGPWNVKFGDQKAMDCQ